MGMRGKEICAEKFWEPTMTLVEVLAVWGITLNERQAQQLLEEMMGAGALLTREEAANDPEVQEMIAQFILKASGWILGLLTDILIGLGGPLVC